MLSHATQIGANTVINFGGGDALTLLNVNRSNLASDDFIFTGGGTSNSAPIITSNGGGDNATSRLPRTRQR